MFALDSLVRNAVQQSVNVLHPENPTAPLDSAIHLEPYPFDVSIKAIFFDYRYKNLSPCYFFLT